MSVLAYTETVSRSDKRLQPLGRCEARQTIFQRCMQDKVPGAPCAQHTGMLRTLALRMHVSTSKEASTQELICKTNKCLDPNAGTAVLPSTAAARERRLAQTRWTRRRRRRRQPV